MRDQNKFVDYERKSELPVTASLPDRAKDYYASEQEKRKPKKKISQLELQPSPLEIIKKLKGKQLKMYEDIQ